MCSNNQSNANGVIFLGFRFYFFANDHEPIHIHIDKDGSHAKFNLFRVHFKL
ncbi:DUF4160 domain-containing protein [Pedobacter sp. BS3]|uniref:DUF4160 domain-containing protein n=1 Tax=Pedobacter sp. BS3 TaxID=2567937 RepID=UPI001F5BC6C8|nr:DUF4160 domain-containing protein [Pedobacter sp. BS3]